MLCQRSPGPAAHGLSLAPTHGHGTASDHAVRPGWGFLRLASIVGVFENLALLWAGQDPGRGLLLDGTNAAVLVGILLWATHRERLGPGELGLTRRGLGRSTLWGVTAGIAMAAPAALFFAFPLVVAQPVRYGGYTGLDAAALILVVIPRLLVTHALLEEVLFRGLVQRQAVLRLGTRKGIALTCGLFVLWHAVVAYHAVVGTNLPGTLPVPLLYVATAIPLAGAGLVFCLLRQSTGNLAGPIIAHWIVNSLILGALVGS